MSESQFLVVAALGVVAVAGSAVTIAICVVSANRSVRRIEKRTAELCDEWQPVAQETKVAVQSFAEQSTEMFSRLSTVAAGLQDRSEKVEAILADVADIAKRNSASVDSTIEQTLGRVSAAAEAIERATQAPIRQVRGIVAAVAAAMRSLTGRRERDPARISADEEMFL